MDLEGDGRGSRERFRMRVEEDGIQACLLGPQDIGIEIVAYHDGALWLSLADAESILEELWSWLVGPSILAEDNGVEVIIHAAGFQLTILHLVESVAAHVEAISPTPQITHQGMSARDDARLDGTALEEEIADLIAELHRRLQPFPTRERTAETLYDQIITRDLAMSILSPQLKIGLPIRVVKVLRVSKIPTEAKMLVHVRESYLGIAARVIDGVVEIYENVSVWKLSMAHFGRILMATEPEAPP